MLSSGILIMKKEKRKRIQDLKEKTHSCMQQEAAAAARAAPASRAAKEEEKSQK